MAELRSTILKAVPEAIEEVKWRKPSNPEGVPVWSQSGILCVGNILKASVRLTFPKGAQIADPKKLFNSRLDSGTVRAIDVHEDEPIDRSALTAILVAAARLNEPTGERRVGRRRAA